MTIYNEAAFTPALETAVKSQGAVDLKSQGKRKREDVVSKSLGPHWPFHVAQDLSGPAEPVCKKIKPTATRPSQSSGKPTEIITIPSDDEDESASLPGRRDVVDLTGLNVLDVEHVTAHQPAPISTGSDPQPCSKPSFSKHAVLPQPRPAPANHVADPWLGMMMKRKQPAAVSRAATSSIASSKKIQSEAKLKVSGPAPPVQSSNPMDRWASSFSRSRSKHTGPLQGLTHPEMPSSLTAAPSLDMKYRDAARSSSAPGPTPPAVSSNDATEPVLCEEQANLVDLILSGKNVFYTGSAGCGKSTVLKAFVAALENRGKKVNIIAPTGRAALAINGSTFWTYAGWTPDHMKKSIKDIEKAGHGKFVRKRLLATHVLVMDEVSMIENHHFERLNRLMKEARGDSRAFGGVQVVVTGDFCQLPPVKPFAFCMECGRELMPTVPDVLYKCKQHGEYHDVDKWAFQSKAWAECQFKHVNLTTIHRQSDKVFIDLLQKCRMGKPFTILEEKLLLDHPSSTENAVKLYPTREEVRRVNQNAFNLLKTEKISYACHDDFVWREHAHPNLKFKSQRNPADNSLVALRDHRFDAHIDLKQGMLVVLLVNLDLNQGLANGSQGTITGWEPYDAAKLDPLDKARSGRSRDMLGGESAALKLANVKHFIGQASRKVWPIVRFLNGVERTIRADCSLHEIGDSKPFSLLSRTQIPLLAAWALSVHKAQGMTLSRVEVDLSRAFEDGQVYVALSRARSLEGLKVVGLGDRSAGGNEQVRRFLWEKLRVS